MEKKTINLKEASFTQAINISAQWCKEWGEDLLSEEVLADRIAELTKTRNGLRGFFAYALSDKDCFCLLYTSPSPRDATLSRMPSSA